MHSKGGASKKESVVAILGAVNVALQLCRNGGSTSFIPVPSSAVANLATMGMACDMPTEDSAVIMHTAGGRRKRLGVGGRVCMLTGRKKKKGYYRTYSEKKNKRYYRPNTHWKKLWWDREKKWVRLYVSARAIRQVDNVGLETMAKRAGLDLYAWCKPHWMPGSRQPLALKCGYTAQSQKDRRYWPDYIPKLNQGAALADIMGEPIRPRKLAPWEPKKPKGPGTPPKRLDVQKMMPVVTEA